MNKKTSDQPHEQGTASSAASVYPPEIEGYEILRMIAHDRFGETWLARRLGRRMLAVRVLHLGKFRDRDAFANALTAIRNFEPISRADSGTLEILQTGELETSFYYVTPIADDLKTGRPLPVGASLAVIENYTPKTLQQHGRAPGDECLRIGLALTGALQTLHTHGRVHGSVQPAQILLVNGDPKLQVPAIEALCGVMLARGRDEYTPPEGPGTPQADIYSLGGVLHELSFGRGAADSARNLRFGETEDEAQSIRWKRVLATACAANPAERFQTGAAFQDELGSVLEPEEPPREGFKAWPIAGVAALVILAAIVSAVYLEVTRQRAPTPAISEAPVAGAPAESASHTEPETLPAELAPEPEAPAQPKAPEPQMAAQSQPAPPPAPEPVAEPAPPAVAPPAKAEPVSVAPPPAAEPAPVAEKPMPRLEIAAVPRQTLPVPPSDPPSPKMESATEPVPPAPEPKTPPPPPAPVDPEPPQPAPQLAAATTAPAAPPLKPGETWTNSLGMKFVSVGDVRMCVWETRVKDFEAFCAATGRQRKRALYESSEMHPVVQVTWADAKAFCEWLTKKELEEGSLPDGHVYRLPTDKEWSLAAGLPPEKGKTPQARDGQFKKAYTWGTNWPPPKGAGNFADVASKRKPPRVIAGYDDGFAQAAPVGSFKANRAGLFDLSGNVWEWCEDSYAQGGTNRVMRGASWADFRPEELSSGYRNTVSPTMRDHIYGFRCVLAKGGN